MIKTKREREGEREKDHEFVVERKVSGERRAAWEGSNERLKTV